MTVIVCGDGSKKISEWRCLRKDGETERISLWVSQTLNRGHDGNCREARTHVTLSVPVSLRKVKQISDPDVSDSK